jgi:hypothetical protein
MKREPGLDLTDDALIVALVEHQGDIDRAAGQAGISRRTVFRRLRSVVNNGLAVCRECHAEEHPGCAALIPGGLVPPGDGVDIHGH